LVPSDLRNLESDDIRKPAHVSVEDAQRVDATVFLGMGEENLHAKADAEERTPRIRRRAHGVVQLQGLEITHGAFRRADAGKDETVGPGDRPRVTSHDRFSAQRRKGVPHARQIPRPVIDDCRHLIPTRLIR